MRGNVAGVAWPSLIGGVSGFLYMLVIQYTSPETMSFGHSIELLAAMVIGGAGSLEVAPGVVRADSDELLHATLDEVGLPREYAAAVRGHRDALNVLRTSNRLWTYFSPAEDIAPGERTGRFRVGGDQPVLDADGRSRVSAEDAAVALIDEVELPRFVQRRFTIGY